MQDAFGVGCHGFFGHADQGGGTGQAFQAAGAATGTARGIRGVQNHHVPRLRRCAGVTGQQFTAQHHTAAHAGTQRNDHRAFGPFGAARQCFAQSGGIGIIGKSNWQAGFGAQIIPHGKIMPVQIVGVAHEAAIHRAGAANANARYQLALCQLIAEGCNIIAHGLGRARQFGGGARFLYNSTVCIHKRSFDIGSPKVHTQIIHDCSLLYITFFSV